MRSSKGFLQVNENVNLKTCAFKEYSPSSKIKKSNSQRNQNLVSPLCLLTLNITETFSKCNPNFFYTTNSIPRRVLTNPSDGVSNGGFDNVNADYILRVNDIIGSYSNHQYRIVDLLGQGTFGQVVKTINVHTNEAFAIKVVKNKPAYFNQGLVEIQILEMLNHRFDNENRHHIVRLKDYFVFRQHLCLVFEILSINLFELLKQNNYRGLSMTLIRCFLLQLIDCLIVLSKANVIHCDLKPENILLENLTSPDVKIIDFGSACFEKQTVYSYIQSRFYRSPEVLVGLQYNSAIDMWSLGCIAAELFLGFPLFAGSSEFNQICRIVDMLGDIPNHLLDRSKKASKFFNRVETKNGYKWILKTEDEYSRENNITLTPSKKYFKYKTLPEIIENYQYKDGISKAELEKEKNLRRSFCDLLLGLLQIDPEKRWTAEQARGHPFITGEYFTVPYVPPKPVFTNRSAPRVIPWGIQNTTIEQSGIAMSYPDMFAPGSFVSTDMMQHPSLPVGSFPLSYDQTFGIPPSPQMHMQTSQHVYQSLHQPHSFGESEHFFPVGNPSKSQTRRPTLNDMRRPQSPKFQKKIQEGRRRGYSFGSYAQAPPPYHNKNNNPPMMNSVHETKGDRYGKNRKNRSYSHSQVPHFLNVETSNIPDRGNRSSPKESPRISRSSSNDSCRATLYDVSPKSSPRTSSDIPRNDLTHESNSPGDWEDQMVFELEPSQDQPMNNSQFQTQPDIFLGIGNIQISHKSSQKNSRLGNHSYGNTGPWSGKTDSFSYKSKKEKKHFREKNYKGTT